MDERSPSIEEQEHIRENVYTLYQDLESYLKKEEYGQDLRDELTKLYPDYLNILEKRRTDIKTSDHGIVIAGETSSGKTTLINKIIGKNIFKIRTHESTGTICRIRNLTEEVRIVCESKTGNETVTYLTEQCNSANCEQTLRKALKNLTDLTSSKESIDIRSVDIGFPNPFLKGNTILVDTPGIGGSGTLTEKLMDYLPNAVSFIFVIDVTRGGGLQDDRLPRILQAIVRRQMENEMPCFDPQDVIFITNKWESIRNEDSEDEKDDKVKTWKRLKSNIKKLWPTVNKEHIFRMDLKHVFKKESSTAQFLKFKEVLEKAIEKASQGRVRQHLRFLKTMTFNMSQCISIRISLEKNTAEEQKTKAEQNQKKITELMEECKSNEKTLSNKITEIIRKTAEECHDYMSTDEGKDSILNPPDRLPIMKVLWIPNKFVNEIDSRVSSYFEQKIENAMQKILQVINDVATFYEQAGSKLSKIEQEWCDNWISEIKISTCLKVVAGKKESVAPIVGLAVASSPLWIPILTLEIGLAILFSPVLFPVLIYATRDEEKQKAIDNVFNARKESIKLKICNHLDENIGSLALRFVKKVTEDLLPKQIQFLEKVIQNLLESREQILQDREKLIKLLEGLNQIKESAEQMSDNMILEA